MFLRFDWHTVSVSVRFGFGFCNSETSKADFFVFVVEQKSAAKSCNAGTKKLAARRLLDATLLDRFKVQLYCLYNSIDGLRELRLKAALAAYQVVTPPLPHFPSNCISS